jgi:protein disulfide-isomerase A1
MFGILLLITVHAKYPEENHVWVFNNKTLPKAVESENKLLIEFYAPWCDHCKEFAPEYSKAAKALKKKGIRIGKIDGSENRDLVDRYKVTGYPTLLYFVNGVPTPYTGARTAEGVIEWMTSRQKNVITQLQDSDTAESFTNQSYISAIYFGSISDSERTVFEFAALSTKDIQFFETNSSTICEKFNVSAPGILFFKDGERIAYDANFSTLDLMKFLDKFKPAKVYEFDDETARKIFDYQSSTFFLLRPEDQKDSYVESLNALALKYKDSFIFAACDLTHPGNPAKLSAALGITSSDQPLAVIVDFNDAFNKYKSNSTSYEDLVSFIDQYHEKKLTPYLKSEPIPEEGTERNVKVLVGLSHNKIIEDQTKDVLVLYYASDHPKCKEFLPIYEKVAKETKRWENFIVSKFNLSYNEVAGLNFKFIPYIVLFTKDNKNGIPYQGDLTKVSIKAFLREHVLKESFDL